jgi:hypothetical protein
LCFGSSREKFDTIPDQNNVVVSSYLHGM